MHAPDQPGQQTPTLLQDLGTVVRLYGTVFWMMGQRLQHGPLWEQRLTDEAVRTYGFGAMHDVRRTVRHPN
ncbi:MAG TPA: hypothetical protein VIT93_00010 [Dehalococcoidia bacterium]